MGATPAETACGTCRRCAEDGRTSMRDPAIGYRTASSGPASGPGTTVSLRRELLR